MGYFRTSKQTGKRKGTSIGGVYKAARTYNTVQRVMAGQGGTRLWNILYGRMVYRLTRGGYKRYHK